MKLLAYPNYKASGVEWLGDVPEHWEVKRLRRVLAESLQYGANESAELDDPDLPRYVRITDVHENGSLRDETFRSLPKDVAAPYLLEDGDLLFARSGATSGKTFLYQNSWGICAYAGYLIRARMNTRKAFPAFIKYFTTSTSYWQWLSSIFIQSTIQNVSAEKYADLYLSLPPLAEQQAIAEFLDRETGRIDRLVAKKRELIERLKEKRTALISRTVTRGLPPAAARAAGLPEKPALKPSGLDWLGDIPAHWDVLQAKRVSSVFVPQRDKPELNTDGDGFPWITVEDLTADTVSKSCKDLFVSFESARENGSRTAPAGSVLAACVGTFGVSSITEREVVINQQIQAYLPVRVHPPFLNIVIRISVPYFEQMATMATISYVNANRFGALPIPFPPHSEQVAIVAYLNAETAKLDALVAKVETAIERLQEYRTALITAAVTGKIDVRACVQ